MSPTAPTGDKSSVLESAIDLIAATSRWDRGDRRSLYMSGTLWHGIMCRSCLLLEHTLRSALIVFAASSGEAVRDAAKTRAASKPLENMTMGQCLGVLEAIVPQIDAIFANRHPELWTENGNYPSVDREAWARILVLRNRMAHYGPGFMESTDLYAGRVWRRYKSGEALVQQAREIWSLGRQLCKSRVALAAISLEGIAPTDALGLMVQVESRHFDLIEVELAGIDSIEEFHARSASDV